jgi:CRP/FNR family transcriptional regulator, cyclic AMP receptor protein
MSLVMGETMQAFPDPSVLSALPLFRDLPPDQLARVAQVVHRQAFPSGTTIFTAGQPAEAVYILLSGTLKVHVEQLDGTDVIIDISGPGDVLGEMAVLDSVGRSASANTLEDAVLLWMDRASFVDCLRTMPVVSLNLVRVLTARLRMANERIQAFASLDVYGRVARHILAFANKYGQTTPEGIVIPLRLTQSDLADFAGASRERVNQVMSFYKQRKYIAVDRNHRITVLNRAALAQRLQ